MRVTFIWPSSAQYTGGVVALYEFANALSRRGHDVQFVHGPANPHRIQHIDELAWFAFEPAITHHIADSLDDPALPEGEVAFSPFAPRRLGLPAVIVQGHGMVPSDLEQHTFRFRGLKVCVASWLVEVGRNYGVPEEQLVHVPCGLDHDLFRLTNPDGERPIDVAVLYNKHLAKGWAVGRAALEQVRRQRPDLRVQVFGILPPEEAQPDWLPFQRGLDRDDLAGNVYNRAKVFLQPSWHEGFGFTAVEAMACGCALVTTDNGGSRDYAVEDRTALIAPPGDAEGLAIGVAALLDDGDRRRDLARRGGDLVRRFTWDRAGELLEGHLERYVADADRFMAEPGPVHEPVVPQVRDAPTDADMVFNVVWTGVVFGPLQYFVASLLAQSGCRFRFVANGCAPSQVAAMEAFRAARPGRVVEVLVVSDEAMVAHGVALDRVRALRHDGELFCLVDPDIKANGPFVADLARLLRTHDAVTSGKEVWSRDNVVPAGNFGVAGEHFYDTDDFVFGSPHLAVYRRETLDRTCERWGVGLGSAGPELSEAATRRMAEAGRSQRVFDTGKIVNVLLQADGYRLVHHELPQIVHIGGLAHFISPPAFRTTDEGEQEPDWTLYPEMADRHEVSRYTAGLLEALVRGDEAGPPPSVGPDLAPKLALVRAEVVDLVARYRPATVPVAGGA